MSMLVNPFWLAAGADDPLGIPDLQLWIDASQETGFSNGDQVSTAQDWSGNNRDATGVVNNILLPTYRASDGPNGTPAFRCQNNATTQGGAFDLPAGFLSGTAGHHFSVVKLDVIPPNDPRAGPPLGDWGTAPQENLYPNDGDGIIYSKFGSTVRHGTGVPPAGVLTSWHVYEERSAANDWSNWFNGVMLFQTFTNTVAWGGAPKMGRGTVGGTSILYGMIAEVIFYNRALTSGEITSTYSYLNDKYAFSL